MKGTNEKVWAIIDKSRVSIKVSYCRRNKTKHKITARFMGYAVVICHNGSKKVKSYKFVAKTHWTTLILSHWGRVTHICVRKLTTFDSDNGLSPGRRQAIIWTNAGIVLIWTIGTNFSEILIEIHTLPFTKMHLKMSSGKWRTFCLGLNVSKKCQDISFCTRCYLLCLNRGAALKGLI